MTRRIRIVEMLLESELDIYLDEKCFKLAKEKPKILELLTKYQNNAINNPHSKILLHRLTPTPPVDKIFVDSEEFQSYMKEIFHLVKTGNLQAVKEKLISRNITIKDVPLPKPFDQDQRTWLHIASAEGHLPLVKFLLTSTENQDIDSPSSNGWTPLHEAANGGHLLVCHYLIKQGASVDVRTSDGNLPLHYFVSHGYLTFLPDDSVQLSNTKTSNPLENDFVQLYKYLSVFEKISGQGKLVNEVTTRKETPLHYACRAPTTLTNVHLLLHQYGAEPNILNKHFCTPLDVAIMSKRIEYFKILVEYGGQTKNPQIATSYPQVFQTLTEIQGEVQKSQMQNQNR